jgi:hypothetical protein
MEKFCGVNIQTSSVYKYIMLVYGIKILCYHNPEKQTSF